MLTHVVVVAVTLLCTGDTTAPSPGRKPEEMFEYDPEAIQEKFNYFDSHLLTELGKSEKGNFVVSPTSIKTLLALVLEGADGTTQEELLNVLRLPQNMTYARRALSSLHSSLEKSGSQKVTIDSVAHVFIAKMLKTNTSYAKTIRDYYKADVSPQDFTSPEVATNNINSWIRTRTGALISDLVHQDMINSFTYAILTTAIYFDGKWKKEFPIQNTKDECFFSEPSLQCQKTPTMAKNEELYYKYDQSLDSHVVQIPYLDERFSMVAVMPRKKDGMRQLTIDTVRLSFPSLLDKMTLFEVNLKMPLFSMEYGTELISTLKQLGLNEVFADNAQLPYMINGRQSRVSAMVHKAKIQVSEKGTKAAAASAAAVVPLMFDLKVINLELNHPFYYFIYDQKSQTVLFAGRLSSVEAVAAAPSSPQPSAVPLGAAGKGNQATSYTAPGSQAGQQYAAPANTAVPSGQQYAAPANTGVPSSQQFYSAPTNSVRPGSQQVYPQPANTFASNQPSYANVAAPGQNYQPGVPQPLSRPGYQVPSRVEAYTAGPKPSSLGTLNHRYNPHASPPPSGKAFPHRDIQYPVSTDDKNYPNYGSQPQTS